MKPCVLFRWAGLRALAFRALTALIILLLAAPALRAQVVNDGATNTLSNVTNTFTGDVTVGTNGSFTLLVLSDNALLTNSASGQIGLNATAKSNEVRLLSPTARWQMGSALIVGNSGASSRLVVSNGASVENSGAVLGFNTGSSNNSVLVTGSGSVWTNRGTMTVGYSGRGNHLVVSNGGWVASRSGNVSLQAGSSHSLVVVSGNGSVWTNQFDLEFAYKDHNNRMIIEAGGAVYADRGRIASGGDLVFGTVPLTNEVLVTGPGSLWANRSAVDLNNALVGGFGQLVVSNGAAVVSGGTATVGGTGNKVVVTGAGSRWANQSDFTFGGSANQLRVSDGAGMVCSNAIIGSLSVGGDDTVLVTGAGSFWTNRGDLTMGFANAVRTVLVISNGASARVGGNASIGPGVDASFNSVSVTDPGTVCTVGLDLYVGNAGSANRLAIRDGAGVGSSNAFLGLAASASGNSALVTGAGTLWSNWNDFVLGNSGAGNELVISNGAAMHIGGDSLVGGDSSARSNSVTVTGSGTKWSVGGVRLFIGSNAPFSRLVISNGALVNSASIASFGDSPDGSNNQAVVTGPGSVWSNRFSIFIGAASDGNQLLVANGGQVHSGHGTVGLNNRRNQAVVTGSGSMWTMGGNLDVGVGGSQSQLIVSNGGTVAAVVEATVGSSFASHNRLTVDGGTLRVTNVSNSGALNVRGGTNVFNAGLIDVDQLVVTNRGEDFFPVVFENNNTITIPSGTTASPYPSTLSVSGLTGVITRVTVILGGLAHTFPDDVDILLVSPGGQKVMLMSDAGGGTDITGNVLTFDDFAAGTLPDTTAIPFFGTYRPTDFEPGEAMPGPAPAGPYSVTLSSFNGSSANGTWRLYVNDDRNPDSGSISDGWSLQITTDGGPAPDRGYFEFNGGTLITRGAVISNGAPFIVGRSGAIPAIWDVRAGASNHVITGDVQVGNNTSFNQLLVTNGGMLRGSFGILGVNSTSSNNVALLMGSGSVWSNANDLSVGRSGPGNQLVVSNGGVLTATSGSLGELAASSNNVAVITGLGSRWTLRSGPLVVGVTGGGNRLVVSNQGSVFDFGSALGLSPDSGNNEVLVTGAGHWSTEGLAIGYSGSANRLVLTDGGRVFSASDVSIGQETSSTNNRVVVDGGSLRVLRSGIGVLDVRRGTNVLNAGLIEADVLRMTNGTRSKFEFNGGTLSVKSSRVSIGPPLIVGNGVSPATFLLASNGTHDFSGTLGLIVSSNATLTGNGSLVVQLQVRPGAQLVPGASVGKISLSTPPFLSGTVAMEISKDGAVLTNDQVQVTGPLTYGGALTVAKLGPTALAAGHNFRLFSASSYSGAFATINLPPLDAGLTWTNKLLVDGSIEVIVAPQPGFANITLSGTNVVISGTNGSPNEPYAVLAATNVALPVTNWVSLATNQFDATGHFSFTNSIVPGIPQRFFRLRTP